MAIKKAKTAKVSTSNKVSASKKGEDSLLDLRKSIDALDRELVVLLDQRAELVERVSRWKTKNSYAMHDPQREQEIFSKILQSEHKHMRDAELQSLFKKVVEFYRQFSSARSLIESANLPAETSVGFFGFGMLAASVGLALKDRYPHWKFLVFDPYIDRAEFVVWNKNIGSGAFQLVGEDSLQNLDFVFLGAPVQINIAKGPGFVERNKYVLNLGSVQKSIQNIIGFHPLAGKETSSYLSAQGDLFYNKVVCITDAHNLSVQSMAVLKMLAQSIGANPYIVPVHEHNHKLAYTSHVLHLLSMAFALCLKERGVEQTPELVPQAARDFLRLAGANHEMWKPIFVENKEFVLNAIADFEVILKQIQREVQEGRDLDSLFFKTHDIYDRFYQQLRRVS